MSAETGRFATGADIAWRSVWTEERAVGTVWASKIVFDDEAQVVLYRPPGTPGKQRTGVRGGPRDRLLLRWDGGYKDLTWVGAHVLIVYRPGDMYSVWRAWDADTWSLKWRYLNLELPWRRTRIGFDSKDLYLDRWCEPGSSEWLWKDEDEAVWAAENGRLSPAQLVAARQAGELAVARITAREAPHDRDWDAWRPDVSWPTPRLPEEWRTFEPGPR